MHSATILVFVNDVLAVWAEAEGDERAVLKIKVIHDSVETARITELVQFDEYGVVDGADFPDRLEPFWVVSR